MKPNPQHRERKVRRSDAHLKPIFIDTETWVYSERKGIWIARVVGHSGGSVIDSHCVPWRYIERCLKIRPKRAQKDEDIVDYGQKLEAAEARAASLERERDETRAEYQQQVTATATAVDAMMVEQRRRIKAESELADALERLRDIAGSGVEFEDERISYVTVQIDRGEWLELQRIAASIKKKGE